MKSLRTRAIFNSCGYKLNVDLGYDKTYENANGDMVYLNLERELYKYNCCKKGRDFARSDLLNKLFIK